MNTIDTLTLPQSSTEPDVKPATPDADAQLRAQAKTAAEKFEGFFIAEMMKQMRRSTRELSGEEGLFKDKVGEDMLEMADGLVADALSGQHAFGVADAILRQLLPAPAPAAAPLNADAALVALKKNTR